MKFFALVLLLCFAFLAPTSFAQTDSSGSTNPSSSTGLPGPVCGPIPVGPTWSVTCENNQVDEECIGRCDSISGDYLNFIMTCETNGSWVTRDTQLSPSADPLEINNATAATFCVVPVVPEQDIVSVIITFELAQVLTSQQQAAFIQALIDQMLLVLNGPSLQEFFSLGFETQVVVAEQILVEIDGLEVTVTLLTSPVGTPALEVVTSEDLYIAFNEVWDDTTSVIYTDGYVAEGTVVEQLVVAQCPDGSFQFPCPSPSLLEDSDSPVVFIIIGILGGILLFGAGFFAYNKLKNKDKKFEDLELNPSALLSTGSTPLPVPQFEMGGYEFHSAGIEENNEGGDNFDDNRIQITIG